MPAAGGWAYWAMLVMLSLLSATFQLRVSKRVLYHEARTFSGYLCLSALFWCSCHTPGALQLLHLLITPLCCRCAADGPELCHAGPLYVSIPISLVAHCQTTACSDAFHITFSSGYNTSSCVGAAHTCMLAKIISESAEQFQVGCSRAMKGTLSKRWRAWVQMSQHSIRTRHAATNACRLGRPSMTACF